MIIVLKPEASQDDARHFLQGIEQRGLQPLYMPGVERTVIGALGDERKLRDLGFENHPLVESIKPILTPYKRVSREMQRHDTQVEIGDAVIGGRAFTVIAGPCAVETPEQIAATAAAVQKAGARILRGGAFKPRTSPYSFQGHGEAGLQMLRRAADAHNLKLVSEVMDVSQIELILKYADILQSSLDFLRELLELARDTVAAEKQIAEVPREERGKAALTELFETLKTDGTPIIVENIVNRIDEVVRGIRFEGWQNTVEGDREVRQALRKTLYVQFKIRDNDVFEKALGYVREYY
jgi:hypothetical protein